MALAFSSNRINGDCGRGTFVSLSDAGVLEATEDSTNNFADEGDTGFAGYRYKRLILVVDGTNSRWVGWGYVGARLDDDTNNFFQMDEITAKNGDVTYFINFRGEAVTPTTSHDVILSGCLQDLDLSANTNNIQESNSKTLYTLSGTPSNNHNGTVFFGDDTHGDQVGVVMHNEFTTVNTGAHLTNGRHARFELDGGFTSWGRVLDYQKGATTGKCHIEHPTTATRDIFSYGQNVNSSTQKGTAIVFTGTILSDAGGRFPGNTGIQSPQTQDNVEIGACLFIDVQTNCDIISGEDGSPLPTSGIAGDWGGIQDNVLRRVESNQFAANGINVRFWGTIEDSSFVQYEAGTSNALSGTGSDSGNNTSTPYTVGAYGTTTTQFPLFRSGNTGFYPFFWRANSDHNQYVNVRNVDSTDRTGRRGESAFSNAQDWQRDLRMRWEYGGEWVDLNENTEIYCTYDDSSASTIGESFFTNEWNDFKPTINGTGDDKSAIVSFTQAIYAGKGDGQWTTRTDNGYREIDPDNTDANNRGLASVQTGWEYSIKDWLSNDVYVDVSTVGVAVGGISCEGIQVSDTLDSNTLSGGSNENGLNQTDDPNIANGNIGDTALSTLRADIVASLGTVSGGQYPNFTKSADTGDVTYTWDDASIDGDIRTAPVDGTNLDGLYGLMAALYRIPASDTEGYKHLVMPFDSPSDDTNIVNGVNQTTGIWDWTDLNADTGVTTVIFRTNSNDDANRISSDANSTITGITFDGSSTTKAIDLNNFVLGNGLSLLSDNPDDDIASFVQLSDTDDIWDDYNTSDNAITDVTLRGRVDVPVSSGTTLAIHFDPASTHDLWTSSTDKFQLRNTGAGDINVYGLTPDTSGIQDAESAAFYSSGTGSINFRKEITVTMVASDSATYTAAVADLNVRAYTKPDGSGSFTALTVSADDISVSNNTFTVTFDIPADEQLHFAAHVDTGANVNSQHVIYQEGLEDNPSEDLTFEEITDAGIPASQNNAGSSLSDSDVTVGSITSNTDDIAVTIDTRQGSPLSDIADLTNDQGRWFLQNMLVRNDDWLDNVARGYIVPKAFTYSASYVYVDDSLQSSDDTWRLLMNGDEDRSFWLLECVVVDSNENSLQYSLTDRSGTNANRVVVVAQSTQGMSILQLRAEGFTTDNLSRIPFLLPIQDQDGNDIEPD